MIIGLTSLMFLIYFPDTGGMLFKAGALKYDPQIVKPPADYKGADVMDYGAQKKSGDEKGVSEVPVEVSTA